MCSAIFFFDFAGDALDGAAVGLPDLSVGAGAEDLVELVACGAIGDVDGEYPADKRDECAAGEQGFGDVLFPEFDDAADLPVGFGVLLFDEIGEEIH